MDGEKKIVSMGMPLNDAEKYLQETLDSILSQTFENFSLIISDNASTDGTQDICQTYRTKDRRIHYFRNKNNLGAAKNFNRTFELSSGKYFKWVAYDDPIAPDYLKKCVDLLDYQPLAIMCYPKTILVDGYGEVLEYHEDGYDLRSPKAHERFRKYFSSSAFCHPVFGLIRSEILRRTGMIGAYPSSDKVLLGELAILGMCYEVPEYLAYRRLHPEISTKLNIKDDDIAAWFDPGSKGQMRAPRLKRFIELWKVINRAPIGTSERMMCHLELSRFYISPKRLAGVGKDIKQLGRSISKFRNGIS